MATFHTVFGLSLECSRPLPHLAIEPSPEGESVEVELGDVPFQLPREPADGWELVVQSWIEDPAGHPMLQIWRRTRGGFYRFYYGDGTEFFVDDRGRRLGSGVYVYRVATAGGAVSGRMTLVK